MLEMFHIYKKNTNELIRHCVSVDELEQMIAKREVKWMDWDLEPCYSDYSLKEEASF